MSRDAEIAKYEQCYRDPSYRMGQRRKAHIKASLAALTPGSLLDVGTGRGETLELAKGFGFSPVLGTETVDYLCYDKNVVYAMGHALPFQDKAFDYVTMFDVMEHLLPEDTAPVCLELARVARKAVLLTVCNRHSSYEHVGDLHINLRPSYADWYRELEQHFGHPIAWEHDPEQVSQLYTITVA